MTKVKICGLRTEQDIRFVNELKPDYVGFVLCEGRKRTISCEEAARLRRLLAPEIPAIGVFVDDPLERVASLLKSGIIQMAQLHGQESAAYAEELKRITDAPILRAFTVRSAADLKSAFSFPADFPLLDNGKGTGETFDWSLLSDTTPQSRQKPFFLAGGITPDNVKEAILRFHPFAVDVSSGVETDGKKDYDKIKALLHAVRR